MNAPWSPNQSRSGGGGRPLFSAFLSDREDTTSAVNEVLEMLGWTDAHMHLGGVHSAITTLATGHSPHILLVDLSESEDPLHDINALAEVCEPGTTVLTMGTINDVRFYRALLASGVYDYFLRPIPTENLLQTLQQVYMSHQAPRENESEASTTHQLITVIGARGGVGASSIAASLASAIAETHEARTALLDFDVYFGTSALYFDVEPGRGVTDALELPSRIDSLFIERAMVHKSPKLSILSAEAPINAALTIDPSALQLLQRELLRGYSCVVADMPRDTVVQYPTLLTDANIVYLVTELTLSGTRDTIRMLALLKAAAPAAQILVVANKVPTTADIEVSRKDFEAAIETNVHTVIPLDVKAAIRAAKMGQPYVEAAKTSKATLAIAKLAEEARAHAAKDPADPSGQGQKSKSKGSFLDKLLAKK